MKGAMLAIGVSVMVWTVSSTAWAATVPALYQASYDLEAVQDYVGALAQMEAIPATDRDYVHHLRRGWLLYVLGRYDESVGAYRAAISASPGSVEARQGLILPLMASRKWVDAKSACEELLAMVPDDYRGTSRLAYIAYNMGKYAESATLYRQVLVHYPSDVEMQAGLGWSLLKNRQYDAARVVFEAILRVAPNHASARDGLQALP